MIWYYHLLIRNIKWNLIQVSLLTVEDEVLPYLVTTLIQFLAEHLWKLNMNWVFAEHARVARGSILDSLKAGPCLLNNFYLVCKFLDTK